MAVVKGPLFSLSASGQIAKSLVYMTWKGIKDVRQHVTPANPQTTDQTTQRDALSDCVSAWKNYFTHATGRSQWNRWALNAAGAMSGFNGFIRNALKLIVTDPDASFAIRLLAAEGQTFYAIMLNLDDGGVGDEVGDFEMWAGSTIGNMTLRESIAIAGGEVNGTVDLGDVADIMYVKIRKAGYDRSGIGRITLTA